MNIFLPYENDIQKSVQSLDDLRLNKQILECYQLLSNAIKEQAGEEVTGYKNHPIYVHYKKDIPFMVYYGTLACLEYCWRFDKMHSLHNYFNYFNMFCLRYDITIDYTPFYMEGSKGQPNYIRTTDNVSELYQKKLIAKWQNDKKPPKWTNREVPSFYQEYLKGV